MFSVISIRTDFKNDAVRGKARSKSIVMCLPSRCIRLGFSSNKAMSEYPTGTLWLSMLFFGSPRRFFKNLVFQPSVPGHGTSAAKGFQSGLGFTKDYPHTLISHQ